MGRKEDREAWTKKVNRDLIARNAKPMARSKYGAVKTDSHGQRFDSAKEAKRGLELAMLQAAREIYGLRRQVPYDCIVIGADGTRVVIGRWIADFEYYDKHERLQVEDVKGMKTALYRWKKKHVEAQYGITILET